VNATARNCIDAAVTGARGGGDDGGVTHADRSAPAAAMMILRRHDAMEWILLEAGVALFLAVFIVWFTTGGKRKPPPPDGNADTDQER
jgi:hypothetical protein